MGMLLQGALVAFSCSCFALAQQALLLLLETDQVSLLLWSFLRCSKIETASHTGILSRQNRANIHSAPVVCRKLMGSWLINRIKFSMTWITTTRDIEDYECYFHHQSFIIALGRLTVHTASLLPSQQVRRLSAHRRALTYVTPELRHA